jgi:L-ascorbate metabolism protein UlaG (beta-lactamase superfamily)
MEDKLLYIGHASLRLTTSDGKIIYVDPYAGNDDSYELPADLILVTHDHFDHNEISKIRHQENATIITEKEALVNGEYKTFDFGYVKVEAVSAGYNQFHDETKCVGYILTLKSGITLYIPGDTTITPQMNSFASRNLDYAFFPMDGTYTMTPELATEAAEKVHAKHSIPYHTDPNNDALNHDIVARFTAKNKLVVEKGEEISLTNS